MKTVTAFQGYAVYADYDGNASDTEDKILCATKKLAQKVVDHLNVNPRKWGGLAYVDGWEFAKSFKYREALRLSASEFHQDFESVMTEFEEEEYDSGEEEEEEEDDGTQTWHKNGPRHREDGPAVEILDGNGDRGEGV